MIRVCFARITQIESDKSVILGEHPYLNLQSSGRFPFQPLDTLWLLPEAAEFAKSHTLSEP